MPLPDDTIQAIQDDCSWDHSPPDRRVDFVFHTYYGFLFFVIQQEHSFSVSPERARDALWRLHKINLTWGLLAYGAVFIPLLSYCNYRVQKTRISMQEEALEAEGIDLSPDDPVNRDCRKRESQLRKIWKAVRDCDDSENGSLRDIYVLDADLDAWQSVLDRMRQRGDDNVAFYHGDQIVELPDDVSDAFNPSGGDRDFRLSVMFAWVTANCHFFSVDTIDFCIDPTKVVGRYQLERLLDFMQDLADTTDRDAILTPEGSRDTPILRVRPGQSIVEHDGKAYIRSMRIA